MREFDLAIVGGGPGGYVAAIRGAQLGMTVALIEKDSALGGCCLNRGCIPTKALLESSKLYASIRDKALSHGIHAEGLSLDFAKMMERKEQAIDQGRKGIDFLIKKNGITRLEGHGKLMGEGRISVAGEVLHARDIILATGSTPWYPPNIQPDGKRIFSSDEILELERLPESLTIIGAGVIGLEMGSIFHRLGVAVEIVELTDSILPGMDSELCKELLRSLKKQKLKIHLSTRVERIEEEGDGLVLHATDKKGQDKEFRSELCLVAVGRTPYVEGLGLENAGVELDERGRVKVDAVLSTGVEGIHAIGDLVKGPMLAHKASEEGVFVVERIAGLKEALVHEVPSAIYTSPEAASIGLSEEDAASQGIDYVKGSFPFRALGRSHAAGELDGLAKIIASRESDQILGAQVVGERASDLIHVVAMAMKEGMTLEEFGETTFGHPTFSEALKEASLAALGRALHV